MEKVESIHRKAPADQGVEGAVLPPEDVRREGAPPEGERTRPRIAEVGSQTLRAATPSRELAKKAAPIQKPVTTSGFHKTLNVVKTILPLVQKALPLLDGNVAAVVANLLVPTFQSANVDLRPLEDGVARLRADHAAVKARVEAQGSALKEVGAQLESLKDAAERLALEQKELAEELHGVRRRVSVFAWVGVGLLGLILVLNTVLLLRVAGIWR